MSMKDEDKDDSQKKEAELGRGAGIANGGFSTDLESAPKSSDNRYIYRIHMEFFLYFDGYER